MKKRDVFSKTIVLFAILAFVFISAFSSCKKEISARPIAGQISQVNADIDIPKISNQVGLAFKILKTNARGYMPTHKYYWICFKEKTDRQKIEALARAVIDETIIKYPETFHSFVIHFFCEPEMHGSPENSKAFAQSLFLPDGDWLEVGRVPIDGYKSYKLGTIILGKNN
jgi:hypothetical protein